MSVVNVNPVVFKTTPLQFQGQSKKARKAGEKQIDTKLQRLKQDLQDLVAWDRHTHVRPVIQNLDLKTILSRAETFLKRQAKDVRTPTPFLIGVAGGTASGKTFTKDKLLMVLPEEAGKTLGWDKKTHGDLVESVMLDDYYRDYRKQRETMGDGRFFAETNLDEPAALTLAQAAQDIIKLKNARAARTPHYEMKTSCRVDGGKQKNPLPFVLVEGLFALLPKTLRQLYDFKVFVDTEESVRMERWWNRAEERNLRRENGGAQALFKRSFEAHNQHVEPTKKHADVVVNGQSGEAVLEKTLRRLSRALLNAFYPEESRS